MKRLTLLLVAICLFAMANAFNVTDKTFTATLKEGDLTAITEMTFHRNGVMESTLRIKGQMPQKSEVRWYQNGNFVYSSADESTYLKTVEKNGKQQLDLYDNGQYVMTFDLVTSSGKR